jgi:hypothetical protein
MEKNSYELYLALHSQLIKFNIKILNDENNRIIPKLYQRSNFNKTSSVFQACIDTGGRIFILLIEVPSIFYVAEALYDLGLRTGDIQIISSGKLGSGDFSDGSSYEILQKEERFIKERSE